VFNGVRQLGFVRSVQDDVVVMDTVVTDAPSQTPGEACVGVAEHRMEEAKVTDDNDLLCLEVTDTPRVCSRAPCGP
jgi:hypothetical protein